MAGLNNSIFDLPHSLEELRRPEDVIKISTRKIIPRAASKRDNFPGSDITFDFVLAGNQHWIPSRSYVVIRDSIYIGRTEPVVGADSPSQPYNSDDMAPALNCQDNLWDGYQLTVGGFSLGSRTKLAPQIAICEKRIMKSAGWLNGAGKSSQCFEPSFTKRQNDITKDGVIPSTKLQNTFTLTGTTEVKTDDTITGVGTRYTSELQIGDTFTVGTGVTAQSITVRVITNATTALATSVNLAEAAGVATKIENAKPSGRSNRNERLFQPALGIFKQGKALPPARSIRPQ